MWSNELEPSDPLDPRSVYFHSSVCPDVYAELNGKTIPVIHSPQTIASVFRRRFDNIKPDIMEGNQTEGKNWTSNNFLSCFS